MRLEPADHYRECLATLGLAHSGNWKMIASHYTGRAYHNLDHLREMLGHLAEPGPDPAPAPAPGRQAALFGLALLYHDLIYRAGRKDNESRSAAALRTFLSRAGIEESAANYTDRLILATKHHRPSRADDGSEALLVDLDLAVLGRDAAGYDRYARQVRKEFSRYPGFLYRRGRKRALLHFLERERIYGTEAFYHRYEMRARQNVAREIATL